MSFQNFPLFNVEATGNSYETALQLQSYANVLVVSDTTTLGNGIILNQNFNIEITNQGTANLYIYPDSISSQINNLGFGNPFILTPGNDQKFTLQNLPEQAGFQYYSFHIMQSDGNIVNANDIQCVSVNSQPAPPGGFVPLNGSLDMTGPLTTISVNVGNSAMGDNGSSMYFEHDSDVILTLDETNGVRSTYPALFNNVDSNGGGLISIATNSDGCQIGKSGQVTSFTSGSTVNFTGTTVEGMPGGMASYVIYQEGGPTNESPLLNNWASVASAISAGTYLVYIDNTYGQCNVSSNINGKGKLVFEMANQTNSNQLNVTNGIQITDLGGWKNIQLVNFGTSLPPLVVSLEQLQISIYGSVLVNDASATVPFLEYTNASTNLTLVLNEFSSIDNSPNTAVPIIQVGPSTSFGIASLVGSSLSGANQITSVDNTASLQFLYDASGSPYSSSSFTGSISNIPIDSVVVPGGASGNVQYNNSAAFSGNSDFNYDGAGNVSITSSLTVGPGSQAAPSLAFSNEAQTGIYENGSSIAFCRMNAPIAEFNQYNCNFDVPVSSNSFQLNNGVENGVISSDADGLSFDATSGAKKIYLCGNSGGAGQGTQVLSYANVFMNDGSTVYGNNFDANGSDPMDIGTTNATSINMLKSGAVMTLASGSTLALSGVDITGTNFITGYDTSSVSQNLFLGKNCGNGSESGSDNLAAGYGTMVSATTAVNNTALGQNSMTSITSGSSNVAVGYDTLVAANVSQCVAIGSQCLAACSGGNNTSIGCQAGINNTSGNSNCYMGYSAGAYNAAGNNNTFIGTNSGASVDHLSNTVAIGYGSSVGVSNGFILGNPSSLVGIGTSSPAYNLSVVGSCQIGSSGTDSVGFYGTTPYGQQNSGNVTPAPVTSEVGTALTDATIFTTTSGQTYTLGQIVQAMSNLGLIE